MGPVLAGTGYAGWRALERTLPDQIARHRADPVVARRIEAARTALPMADTAAALVADRSLREVALVAYGLGADLASRAFTQRVLESSELDPGALANRLADRRYAAMARNFGYGEGAPQVAAPGFADRLIDRYARASFEEAVGEQDNRMRLALHAGGAIDAIVDEVASSRARWFRLMGEPPLREVVATALGVPKAAAGLDLDRQLQIFTDAAERRLGVREVADLADPAVQDRMLRLFFLRGEMAVAASPRGATALALLRR